MTSLFSTAYLPPISYIQKCISDEIIIDAYEHFIKQTYRNRCCIYGPNGKQVLVIPLVHDDLFRTPIKDIRISFEERWNKIHWKSITSAYRNSPFFEYFETGFEKLYDNVPEKLFDFNNMLLKLILDSFKIKKEFSFSEEYNSNPSPFIDLRNVFHPKKDLHAVKKYHQVFEDRFGFINDLSAIDYLFNVGKL